MPGVVAYGAYVPRHRLDRGAITAILGSGGGRGSRTVASYDEDATSMGVEAARSVMRAGVSPRSVYLATTAPPYADKTNAVAVHAALGLDRDCFAVDFGASSRSAVGALRAAAVSGGIAVLSDIRTGSPGSADERDGGDAAAAFAFGEGDDVVARVIAESSVTGEFLDRWRRPGDHRSHVWEERFGRTQYLPMAQEAVAQVLSSDGVGTPTHVVISSPHRRVAKMLAAGFSREQTTAVATQAEIGYSGAADPGIGLADVLDRAAPGDVILVVVAADGCDAIALEVTPAIERLDRSQTVRDQLALGREVSYGDYLTWRGILERESPRRPDPPAPAGPPAARNEAWKFRFTGSRCVACEAMHVPPQRTCVGCGAVDRMREESLAERLGTITTFSVDRLAYSLAPPVIDAVVDFDGGGRRQCQMTDVRPDEIAVGDRVELSFRRVYTAQDVHNYFWKARPARAGHSNDTENAHGE
jgi:3-hydroxy-3-methylglutaryl CoA synthase/uncharacterized OB-fold protein